MSKSLVSYLSTFNQFSNTDFFLIFYTKLITVKYFNYNNSLISEEYLPILLIILVGTILSIIIVLLSYFLAVQNPETEKLSAYECGFEPYEDSRHKFNINFYIVAILFIVFDIEAMYLFSWSVSLSSLDLIGFWSMIDFIIELGVGFLYVIYIGALDWE